jgi:hypothetical protein
MGALAAVKSEARPLLRAIIGAYMCAVTGVATGITGTAAGAVALLPWARCGLRLRE